MRLPLAGEVGWGSHLGGSHLGEGAARDTLTRRATRDDLSRKRER
ncbi:MAG TPA: hypothetical protein VIZ17_07505 [Acetobacteraceae bacterium]